MELYSGGRRAVQCVDARDVGGEEEEAGRGGGGETGDRAGVVSECSFGSSHD